jgi:hypothetical protein
MRPDLASGSLGWGVPMMVGVDIQRTTREWDVETAGGDEPLTDVWTPLPSDDEQRWNERVVRDVRPLLERCERLRDRGLLE